MAEKFQVYKCEVCGNIVEVLHGGRGDLVCCGQPMVLCAENTTDAAQEKHVPVVDTAGDQVLVKVGSVPHPMADEHYIEWVEVMVGDKMIRHDLKPGDQPEASFSPGGDVRAARAYCNLHGLWKS